MMRTARSFIVALAVLGMLLAVAPAQAEEVKILKSAVSSSTGPGGEPQLDLHLLVQKSFPEPSSLIAYFFDAETGAPMAAPKGSPFSTKNGQVAAKSETVAGTSKTVVYEETISIPHFAFDYYQKKHNRIRVEFFLDPGDAYDSDNLVFADELGFDFTIKNPFGHGKHGKHSKRNIIEVLRPSFRELLPDRPLIRNDALGMYRVFTATDGIAIPRLDRRSTLSVITVAGQSVILGGNVQWRFEGSGNSIPGLIDKLEIQNAIILMRKPLKLDLGGVGPGDSSQVRLESRFLEVGNQNDLGIDFDFKIDSIEAFKEEPKVPFLGDIPTLGQLFRNPNNHLKRNLMIFITPRILSTREE